MTSLVLAGRQIRLGEQDLTPHLQQLPGGLEVLAGPASADSATVLDQEFANVSAGLLLSDTDVVVDCGRIVSSAPGQRRLLREADLLLLVTRADGSSVVHARSAIERVEALGIAGQVSLILWGDGPFSVDETSTFVGTEVKGVVPFDPKGAAAVCGVPGKARALPKSSLIASARRIAARVLSDLHSEPMRHRTPDVSAESRTTDFVTLTDSRSTDEACQMLTSDRNLDRDRESSSAQPTPRVKAR